MATAARNKLVYLHIGIQEKSNCHLTRQLLKEAGERTRRRYQALDVMLRARKVSSGKNGSGLLEAETLLIGSNFEASDVHFLNERAGSFSLDCEIYDGCWWRKIRNERLPWWTVLMVESIGWTGRDQTSFFHSHSRRTKKRC